MKSKDEEIEKRIKSKDEEMEKRMKSKDEKMRAFVCAQMKEANAQIDDDEGGDDSQLQKDGSEEDMRNSLL